MIRTLAEAVLRPFAGVVFARDLGAGLLILLAVACFPRLAGAALLAVAVAAVTTLLFGLGGRAVRDGSYGCTAVLTTLALGAFEPGGSHPWLLVVFGAALAVLFTASFEAVFTAVALPTHSLPFVAAAWTVHLAARSLPETLKPTWFMRPASVLPDSLFQPTWLDVPAALLFSYGIVPGVLVLAAILVHSRIALVLAAIGGAASMGVHYLLRGAAPWSLLDTTAAFNGMLAAIALGGVWFVPHTSSLLLAAGSAAVASVLSYALFPALSVAYLPVISLPFVITTHLVLTASRRRQQDRWPRSTVPAERPEEALARDLSRVRRFGEMAWLPFRLPLRGEWFVSQGHDGKHTHKGLWRHGLDFEARGADGRGFEGQGKELRDYRCFGLPVLAAGNGTVALVVDGVADNRPGEMNLRENWGNAVVVSHGPALYSVYAHLQARTLKVKPGDRVAAGTELGRCGNSGRSATPHLHFQVQGAAPLGSPTLPADFGDVITVVDGAAVMRSRAIPSEGQAVRAVIRDETLAKALAFTPGAVFLLTDRTTGVSERATVEVDLLGRTMLRSDRATVFLEAYETGLVMLDFAGDNRSLLRYVLVGLARVPFDKSASLSWHDDLPLRLFMPGWLRALADLFAVFAPRVGSTTVRYASRREEGTLELRGETDKWSSLTRIQLGGGAHELEFIYQGKRTVVQLAPEAPPTRDVS
jgi:murein DD-endopeptidase MepM/ murein hydrolase activator NlpD